MLMEYAEVIRTLIELAEINNIEYWKSHKSGEAVDICEGINELIENLAVGKKPDAERKLCDYLSKLDLETLEVIQAVMYMGRDYNKFEDVTPEETYKLLYKSLHRDGQDKWIIENQIEGKLPLDKYLKRGAELLNIF